MAKESLYGIDKGLLFRETFNSEFDVRKKNNGTPTSVTFSNGVASFNGTSSKITYGNGYAVTNGITIKARILTTDITKNYQVILDKRLADYDANYYLRLDSGYARFAFLNSNLDQNIITDDTTRLQNNVYYTVVATYDKSNMKLYVNGTLVKQQAETSQFLKTLGNVSIGYSSYNNDYYFKGNIELVETYNYAWTASQVANDYNNSTFKDIRNGLLLDLDSRQGVLEDKMGNTLNAIALTNTLPIIKFNKGKYSTYYYEPSGYPIILDADKFSFGNGTTDLPFSISCWAQGFKTGSFALMSKLVSGQSEYVFGYNANTIIARLFDQSAGSYIGRTAPFIGATKNGSINHFAMTYSGSRTSAGVKIYINGVQVDNANSNSGVYTAMENTTAYLKSGRWDGVANHVGYLDIARLYNRELSANEVSQLYTNQKFYFV